MSNNICNLPDMQKSTEGFNKIPLKKVGMRNVELPVQIWQEAEQKLIDVKATFSSYCNLVPNVKGINMSRITRTLIDVVQNHRVSGDLGSENTRPGYALMDEFAKELMEAHTSDNKDDLNTDHVYVKMEFDYPFWIKTPASGLNSVEYVTVVFETVRTLTETRRFMTVKNAGLSLCPCSREMSLLYNNISDREKALLEELPLTLIDKLKRAGFGAHNQRSYIDVTVECSNTEQPLFIEDIVELADKSFSCPTKTVLKRPDEKVVTETPYAGGYYAQMDNGEYGLIEVEGTGAKFVEDIARDCAGYLDSHLDSKIRDYVVVVNNQESIHSRNIDAVAVVTAGRDLT